MAVSKGSGRCCAIAMPCDELTLSFDKAWGQEPSAEPHTPTLRTPTVLVVKTGSLINRKPAGLPNMAMEHFGANILNVAQLTWYTRPISIHHIAIILDVVYSAATFCPIW